MSQLDYDVALLRVDPTYFGFDPYVPLQMMWGDGVGDVITSWSTSDPDNFNLLVDLMKEACVQPENQMTEALSKCYDLISQQVPAYPLLFWNVSTA